MNGKELGIKFLQQHQPDKLVNTGRVIAENIAARVSITLMEFHPFAAKSRPKRQDGKHKQTEAPYRIGWRMGLLTYHPDWTEEQMQKALDKTEKMWQQNRKEMIERWAKLNEVIRRQMKGEITDDEADELARPYIDVDIDD